MAVEVDGIYMTDRDYRLYKKKKREEELSWWKKSSLVWKDIRYFEWLDMFDWVIIEELSSSEVIVEAFNRNITKDQSPFKKKKLIKEIKYA